MCPAVGSANLPPTSIVVAASPVTDGAKNREFISQFISIEHAKLSTIPSKNKPPKRKPAVRFFCSLKKGILRCIKSISHRKKGGKTPPKETQLNKIKHIQGMSKSVDKKYSTGSIPEDEYNEKLHEIKYRGMKTYSEMMVFARENAEFISPQSIKGRYFKQCLEKLNNDIDKLQHQYRSIGIKNAWVKGRDAHDQISKYLKKLDSLNENDYQKQLKEIEKKISSLNTEMLELTKIKKKHIQQNRNKYYYFDKTLDRLIGRIEHLGEAFKGTEFNVAQKEAYKLTVAAAHRLDKFAGDFRMRK